MKKAVSAILVLLLALSLGATAFAEYGILVTRHPTDCNCMSGETVCFVSDAKYYSSVDWTFVDPCGTEYSVPEFRNMFPYMSVEGEHTTMLTIRNPGTELNGWAVFCRFHSDIDNASTNWGFFNINEYAPSPYSAPANIIPFNN